MDILLNERANLHSGHKVERMSSGKKLRGCLYICSCIAWLSFAFQISLAFCFACASCLPPSLGQKQEVLGKVELVEASFPEPFCSLPAPNDSQPGFLLPS